MRLRKSAALGPFRYRDKGSMAAVGRGYAIMQGMGMRTAGLFAKLVWTFVHITFLALPAQRVQTIFVWLWTALTRRRLDCLIVEPTPPAKLARPTSTHIEAH